MTESLGLPRTIISLIETLEQVDQLTDTESDELIAMIVAFSKRAFDRSIVQGHHHSIYLTHFSHYIPWLSDTYRPHGVNFDELGRALDSLYNDEIVKKIKLTIDTEVADKLRKTASKIRKADSFRDANQSNIEKAVLEVIHSRLLTDVASRQLIAALESPHSHLSCNHVNTKTLLTYPIWQNTKQGEDIQNLCYLALCLKEKLIALHNNPSQNHYSGISFCSVIQHYGHLAVVFSGDVAAFHLAIDLMANKIAVLEQLNPIHDLAEDYFLLHAVNKGGALLEHAETGKAMLNGRRATSFAIGDHDVGLGNFCEVDNIIYPNFCNKITPNLVHMILLTPDSSAIGKYHDVISTYLASQKKTDELHEDIALLLMNSFNIAVTIEKLNPTLTNAVKFHTMVSGRDEDSLARLSLSIVDEIANEISDIKKQTTEPINSPSSSGLLSFLAKFKKSS